MACILLWSSAVRVHDSQAYRKMDVTRECISRILELREILSLSHAVHVFNINQLSLPTPFYTVLVSIWVFMALSTVFHSINSPDNFLLSHSVLPVLFLPSWSLQVMYPFVKVSFSPDIILCC